jgi:hypothetical protein
VQAIESILQWVELGKGWIGVGLVGCARDELAEFHALAKRVDEQNAELAEKDAQIERLTKEVHDEIDASRSYYIKWSAALAQLDALREQIRALAEENEIGAGSTLGETSCAVSAAPTTATLVPVERLREVRGTIEQLLCVQNGCPLPSYEEAFRLANMEAGKTLAWIAGAIRDAELLNDDDTAPRE